MYNSNNNRRQGLIAKMAKVKERKVARAIEQTRMIREERR